MPRWAPARGRSRACGRATTCRRWDRWAEAIQSRHPERRCSSRAGAAPQLVGLAEVGRRIARLEGALHVCTDDGSRGMRGTVVQLLERLAPGFALPIVIHACGPHAMLRAVAEWAVARDIRAYLAM